MLSNAQSLPRIISRVEGFRLVRSDNYFSNLLSRTICAQCKRQRNPSGEQYFDQFYQKYYSFRENQNVPVIKLMFLETFWSFREFFLNLSTLDSKVLGENLILLKVFSSVNHNVTTLFSKSCVSIYLINIVINNHVIRRITYVFYWFSINYSVNNSNHKHIEFDINK